MPKSEISNCFVSIYLPSLSDVPIRRLVASDDSERIQDETTESSACFLNPSQTRPRSQNVDVKPVRRSANLYDAEGTQYKPLSCDHIELYYSGIRCMFMQGTRIVRIEQGYFVIPGHIRWHYFKQPYTCVRYRIVGIVRIPFSCSVYCPVRMCQLDFVRTCVQRSDNV